VQFEIRVDRDRCIGSGQCVRVAAGVFDQDDEAKAVVTDSRGDPAEKVVHALTACPVQAISVWVDGTQVGPGDLEDWQRGARSGDPVVMALEQLCDDHHQLQAALAPGAEGGGVSDEALAELARRHLGTEAEVYSTIAELIDPRLVSAFEANHTVIDRALHGLCAQNADPSGRLEARDHLARAVGDHIQLEETVLFPAALAALARD
jgi:ferredoxin